jgi:peptidoglycan hydrolase FlgJ
MTSIGGPSPVRNSTPADPAATAQDAKLHKVSSQLEGVFVQEMYKSMRATVPSGGLFDGGSGEEMFTGMLDEHIAADTPQHWKHGLSESIYRQLRDKIHAQNPSLPPDSSLVTSTGVDK